MAALTDRSATLRVPFLLSYGLGTLLLQPWSVDSWQQLGMLAVMLLMLLLWTAAGCVVGAVPAMIFVALARRLARSKQ